MNAATYTIEVKPLSGIVYVMRNGSAYASTDSREAAEAIVAECIRRDEAKQ